MHVTEFEIGYFLYSGSVYKIKRKIKSQNCIHELFILILFFDVVNPDVRLGIDSVYFLRKIIFLANSLTFVRFWFHV